MGDADEPKPAKTPDAKAGREAKLAEALRANLRRRKETVPASLPKKD